MVQSSIILVYTNIYIIPSVITTLLVNSVYVLVWQVILSRDPGSIDLSQTFSHCLTQIVSIALNAYSCSTKSCTALTCIYTCDVLTLILHSVAIYSLCEN